MGNNQASNSKKRKSGISASQFGDILIKTDKSYYFSGEVVIGNIYLNVIKDGFPGCVVYLRVSGKEKCQWTETTTNTSSDSDGNTTESTSTSTYTGKSYIYQHKLVIHNFESPSLPLGQFVFPFQFQLLSHLPSSFYQNDVAQISYKVKAAIQSKKSSLNCIMSIQRLIIREPLRQNTQPLTGNMQIHSQDCCFPSDGVCLINCSIDKHNYLPGDVAHLEINIDNSSLDEQITSISIIFLNTLTLTDDSGRQKLQNWIVQKNEIQGVGPRRKSQKNVRFLLQNNKSPQEIQPSANGRLVNSVYSILIKVNLESDSCCFKEDPLITFQIQIVAAVPQSTDPVLIEPPDWNPQVFSIQKVYLTDRNKQTGKILNQDDQNGQHKKNDCIKGNSVLDIQQQMQE
ncbi:unnamed protein product (macronuclear) [Paramecium tetraurelia]|uniref:Arrestin C-terminal-like domain-containing protein n=1 Tax=Paramecium tetraurelia TaxID=5888 RepID=A0CZ40_PARTE|nr:uncharacterized protein GSPATT00011658001 [Paramecium tetraurelia]CAK76057.1 unnamed protein product [Paramecium tetraurelia]|eukprot:XP_001443454.1 hypothetical protein (macronuclear) [Paramecium tetraurelia strain d4-2]